MDNLSFRKIPLSKGKFAIVNSEDFEWLNQWKWHFTNKYAARWVRLANRKPKHIYMHRVILEKYNLLKENLQPDHINRDKLDNRIENLRMATATQNQANRGIDKTSTSGFKGVTWDGTTTNRDRKWLARIKANNKHINLGRFLTKEEAAIAYNQASQRYYGEFAYQNQIGGQFG